MKTYQRYFIVAMHVTGIVAIACTAFLVLTFNWHETDPWAIFPAK